MSDGKCQNYNLSFLFFLIPTTAKYADPNNVNTNAPLPTGTGSPSSGSPPGPLYIGPFGT